MKTMVKSIHNIPRIWSGRAGDGEDGARTVVKAGGCRSWGHGERR